MTTQNGKAERFFSLHQGYFIIPTIWDRLSAIAAYEAGFGAVATSSAALGFANGYLSSERMPFAEVTARLSEIAGAVPIPVSVDMENGYPEWTGDIADSVRAIIDAGVVAANIEDSDGDHSHPLVEAEAHARAIAAARRAADASGARFFINARTDIFMSSPAPDPGKAAEEAIRRARLYVAAGADGIYTPARDLPDEIVARLAKGISVPLTVLAPQRSFRHWASLGARRISLGTAPIRTAYAALQGHLAAAAQGGLNIAPAADIDGAWRRVREASHGGGITA